VPALALQRLTADARPAAPETILALQRSVGNQAVQRLLAASPSGASSPPIQRLKWKNVKAGVKAKFMPVNRWLKNVLLLGKYAKEKATYPVHQAGDKVNDWRKERLADKLAKDYEEQYGVEIDPADIENQPEYQQFVAKHGGATKRGINF
jgi:hypothetical protein